MSQKKFENIVFEIDELVKSGDIGTAQKGLLINAKGRLTRAQSVDYAHLSNRANLPHLAYKLLRPYVFSKKVNITPTATEQMQMARCLTKMGAIDFAESLLNQINHEAEPEVLLQRSLIHMSRWDYGSAIPLLQKFVENRLLEDHRKLIGYLNLAASLAVIGPQVQLFETINIAKELAHRLGHNLAMSNLYEIEAQGFYQENDFQKAIKKLEEASLVTDKRSSHYSILIEKWSAIINLTQNQSIENLKRLDSVRQRALSEKLWEVVRDCDYHFAKLKKDEYLFQRVFFGTSHVHFRERMIKEFSFIKITGSSFLWSGTFSSQMTNQKNTPIVDLTEFNVSVGRQHFDQFHQVVHLFRCLCQDFYAPLKTAALYTKLFPGNIFDPEHGTQKVFNAISKLNSLFKTEKIPLQAIAEEDGYRLKFISPILIKVEMDMKLLDRDTFVWGKILENFPTTDFSLVELRSVVNVPERTLQRLIKNRIDSQLLAKVKSGASARYRILK